jgi:hypothetical protein
MALIINLRVAGEIKYQVKSDPFNITLNYLY